MKQKEFDENNKKECSSCLYHSFYAGIHKCHFDEWGQYCLKVRKNKPTKPHNVCANYHYENEICEHCSHLTRSNPFVDCECSLDDELRDFSEFCKDFEFEEDKDLDENYEGEEENE